ncbi:MAG: hypothetical protein CML17_00740 [Pusillimonas sp.]|jgi:hypothetical protein|nr:hypothetical protein [Pusillimonas sp.]
MSSTWETLSKIDVSEHTEEKNGLTYLSWAWAWGKVKDNYPKARYVKRIWDTELPYTKDDQGYAYVEVTVIIGDEEQSELMPVLDYKNQSVKNPNSFQVNTALQRCLAKCCAMHGLGHYIYAGEDLPQGMEEPEPEVSIHPAEGDAKEAKGYKLISEIFTTFIPECEDVATLRSFWGKNKNALEILKKGNKELYEKVLGNFTEHSETLKKGEAA